MASASEPILLLDKDDTEEEEEEEEREGEEEDYLIVSSAPGRFCSGGPERKAPPPRLARALTEDDVVCVSQSQGTPRKAPGSAAAAAAVTVAAPRERSPRRLSGKSAAASCSSSSSNSSSGSSTSNGRDSILAAAYIAFRFYLSTLQTRSTTKRSLTITAKTAQDWDALLAGLGGQDLTRSLVVELPMENIPFAACAPGILAAMLADPRLFTLSRGKHVPNLPQRDAAPPPLKKRRSREKGKRTPETVVLDDDSEAPKCTPEFFKGLGRFFAKCAVDCIHIDSPFPAIFIEYMLTGTMFKTVESVAAVLPNVDSETRRLCETLSLCKEDPRGPIRKFFLERYGEQLEALREGFVSALPWRDHLHMLATLWSPEEMRLLMFGKAVLGIDKIVSFLVCQDEDEMRFKWLVETLRRLPTEQHRLFLAKATGQLDPDKGVWISVTTLATKGDALVVFHPENRLLVLPLCKSMKELEDALCMALGTTPIAPEHKCGACMETFSERDGVACSQLHFLCDTCIDVHVLSSCKAEAAELLQRPGGVMVCTECKESFSDDVLAPHLSKEAAQQLKAAQLKVLEHKIKMEAKKEADERLHQELDRLSKLSQEERDVIVHRNHIANEILTLRCPRAACRKPFFDFTGCFALTCKDERGHGCGATFCAICLKDCGKDAHHHVQKCNGSYYGTVDTLNMRWREQRTKLVGEYLAKITSPVLLAAVKKACVKDFADLGIVL